MSRVGPVVLVVAVVLAAGVGVGLGAAATATGTTDETSVSDAGDAEVVRQVETDDEPVDYGEFSDQLATLAGASADDPVPDTLSAEKREAASEGAREGVRLAQEQGINVTQQQEAAAVNSSLRAAAGVENAPVEDVRAAAKGASHGVLLQSQRVNITQMQAAVYGSAAGSLSQYQRANVTQLQAAAYGTGHGAVAQHQRANVTQIQFAAVGSAAGAAYSAGQSQQANVTQIQEAGQGSAYGALEQRQEVTVVQIQAAAFGAGAGGADKSGASNPKKVQEAAMGAAKGVLVQRQDANVTQIQAAANGACKGALRQSQRISVVQIQQASLGAAKGAISQHQVATVRQIQAAATGAAGGSLTQVQEVDIVQRQYAAAGAAKGAAKSAGQRQIVNVEQIQAAARGAGQGGIVQIQQVNVVQVQAITEGAASGALSQYQRASVVQIQSAARGASEGTLSVTQIQIVNIQQIQTLSQRTAADTARISVDIDITDETTIYNYGKGTAKDPDREEDPALRSLFFGAEEEALFLANPNDEAVTVTVTSEAGDVQTVTLSPGESLTRDVDPGVYTLTAETADGRTVEITGRESLRVAVGEQLQSLTATIDDDRLVVSNPNDAAGMVVVREDGTVVERISVGPTGVESWELPPGTYTLTAQVDGQAAPVNGEDEATVTVEGPINLRTEVSGQNVTVTNPNETGVTVTATDGEGNDTEINVPADSTVNETLDPGNYTLTGEAEDGRDVLVNGQQAAEIEIESPPDEPAAANFTVEIASVNESVAAGETLDVTATVTNVGSGEGEANVTLGVDGREVDSETVTLGAGENETVALTYETDENDTGERNVTVATPDDSATTTVEVTETATTAELQVDNQTGNGTTLNVSRATANVAFSLEARYGGELSQSENFSADETAENETLVLDPPIENDTTVEVAIVATEDGEELATQEINYTAEPDAEPEPQAELQVDDQTGNGTALDVSRATADVVFYLEARYDEELSQSENFSADETVENETLALDPPIENDTAIEVAIVAAEDGEELATQEINYTVEPDAEPEPEAELQVDDQTGDGTTLNVSRANASVGFALEARYDGETAPSENFSAGTAVENETLELDPPIENDTTVEVAIVATEDGEELATQEINYTVERETVDLNVSVVGQNVTVDNPSDTAVTVTATENETGTETELAVPAIANVTETFDPGNYTLTSEAEDGREVTLDGQAERAIIVESDEFDRLVDTCTNITESGSYELDGDIQADSEETCLRITTSDVTLAGNGYAIDGVGPAEGADGASAGIQVGSDAASVENVTVRDVQVSGYDTGIRTALEDGDATVVTVVNATVRNNANGTAVAGGTATLRNVTATDNAVHGLVVGDGSEATATNLTSRENGGDAVAVVGTATLDNATVADSDGLELEARNGTATAGDLGVGQTATVAFEDQSVGLDTVARADLPDLPDEAEAVDAGLSVLSLDGSADLRLDVATTDVDDPVELWRYNGTAWVPVDDATVTAEGVNATVTESGVYAAVAVAAEGVNATVGNRAVWAENPTDQPLTVTVENDTGVVETRTVAPGANESIEGLSPGAYTLTAETGDGETVPVDGEPTLSFSLPPDLASLDLTVEVDTVSVANPNDEAVDLTLESETSETTSRSIDPGTTEQFGSDELDSGNYTASAETADGRSVPVNGAWNITVAFEGILEPVDVSVSVDEQAVTVDNPAETGVTVTATDDAGGETQIRVSAGETTTETLEPGTYTLTGEADDGRPVTLDGQEALTITIEEQPPAVTTTESTATETEAGPPETETQQPTPTETETQQPTPTETVTTETQTEETAETQNETTVEE
ncbi:hypothetical protein [Salinibaculum salinum]|uniref:hypothetical protein n=1 Tax=Salinibaculum salinum TaxID=3131996 RepID=UPI0030EDD129